MGEGWRKGYRYERHYMREYIENLGKGGVIGKVGVWKGKEEVEEKERRL